MIESEIAGNFPNQNNHHIADIATGNSHGHDGQTSPSMHHDNAHEDDEIQPEKGESMNMLTRLLVFGGLLLALSFNSVNALAAADDKNNPDSPEINVVYEWDESEEVNFDDINSGRLDINFNEIVSLNSDNRVKNSLGDVDLNVGDNRAYDDEIVDDGADLFDRFDLPSANESDINNSLNV